MSRSEAGALPRVVVAASGLGHVSRGVETWAADMARALHERGVRVTLCKGSGRVCEPYERVVPCVRRDSAAAGRVMRALPRWLGWRLGVGSGYGLEQATFAFGLVRYLRRERVDLLHVQDPLVALIVERARRVGFVRTRTILAHGTEEGPEFLRKLGIVQHLAPRHEEDCVSAGVHKAGWFTEPNFVDTERFAPGRGGDLRRELNIPEEAVVVLTAAAIKRTHKRVDWLLEEVAAAVRSRPELPLYLVVAGGEEKQTREVVELGRGLLGDRVRFLVSFPRERMAELYAAADLFVLASLREMMPIAVLEATASGLACVVHDDPVLGWMVGGGGKIIAMDRRGELGAAVVELASDPGRRAALGAAARARCVSMFGRDAVVGRVVKTYERILGRPVAAERARGGVSVVIPTYNCGRWVVEAVRSALAQTHAPEQVIVVDDGSSDDTMARLAPFRGRIVLERQPNRGVAAARNRGLALATGEYVAFLDADDVWHPRKLELQVAAMAGRPGLGILGTRTCDCSSVEAQAVGGAAVRVIPPDRLAVKNYLTTSSVMVRRGVVERVGGFDTSLQGPEDHDYWIRGATAAGVAVLELPLTGYRLVPGSLSRRAGAMEAGVRRILAKLDAQGYWGRRWPLRRRAYAYAANASAFLFSDEGQTGRALARVLASLAWYPLPFRGGEVGTRLVRLRRLAALTWRLVRSRAGVSGGAAAMGADRAAETVPDGGAERVEAEAHAAF